MNNESKIVSLFKKLYHYRFRIDRKGKTIVNLSSLFSLACLIFAPHMTIAGIILSLVMGYHINLETENEDEELEKRFREAADTVKNTAAKAARTIKEEIEKARTEAGNKQTAAQAQPEAAAEAVRKPQAAQAPGHPAAQAAEAPEAPQTAPEAAPAEPVRPDPQTEQSPRTEVHSAPTINADLLKDLESHAEDFQSNPAVHRSAYSASAGTVPTLQVHEEDGKPEDSSRKNYMQ